MRHFPKVSYIIPFFNEGYALPRCLDSVLGQNYPNSEIILVNDASTDNSGEVCEEYARRDGRITVIHQEKSGVSAARNAGMKIATGEFFQFVDADDYLLPGMTSELVEKHQKNNGVDMVVCGMLHHYEYPDGTGKTEKRGGVLPDGVYDIPGYIMLYADGGRTIGEMWSPCNKLFSAEIIHRNNLSYRNGMTSFEDGLFNMHYLEHCKTVCVISRDYYMYVIGFTPQTVASNNKYRHDQLWNQVEVFSKVTELAIPADDAWRLQGTLASNLIIALVGLCRRDATIGDEEIVAQLSRLSNCPEVRTWFSHYRPLPGQSRLIPLLLKWRFSRLLFYLARYKADRRYGGIRTSDCS